MRKVRPPIETSARNGARGNRNETWPKGWDETRSRLGATRKGLRRMPSKTEGGLRPAAHTFLL